MTYFQGSFRRALFFLENSRKLAEATFRSTVRYVVTAPPEDLQAAEFGAISQFVLVSANAKCFWATAEASPTKRRARVGAMLGIPAVSGQSRRGNECNYIRWCFADSETAALFEKEFC